MKTKFILAVLVSILVISAIVSASMIIPSSDKAKEHAKAPGNSPVIGENWDLERVDFIHYAKPTCNNNGLCEPELGEKKNCGDCGSSEDPTPTEKCYKTMKVQWRSLPVSYHINPSNPQGLTENFITSTISESAETWDDATSSELVSDVYTIDYSSQYDIQNFENAIVFGDYFDSNVIGITTIWYTMRGKRIVEFDILLNTDFAWGDAELDSSVMDLQNIAVHELGHGFGMDDIYHDSCNEVTMYGYSTEGETKKRTLEQPDILGLQSMYSV